jgi:hypothetical protein
MRLAIFAFRGGLATAVLTGVAPVNCEVFVDICEVCAVAPVAAADTFPLAVTLLVTLLIGIVLLTPSGMV